MTKPTRQMRKRTTPLQGQPEQLAEHFATCGDYWPTDSAAAWAAIQPQRDDWTPVAAILRRRVPKRAFEMLEREFASGLCRPFAFWPRESLAELRQMLGNPGDD